MFGWFKTKSKTSSADHGVAHRPPGEIFAWPKGVVLTAIDEVVLALPTALFDRDRPIGDCLFGPDDMEFTLPPNSDACFVKLQPGMSVSLAKSCQAYVVADDNRRRRIRLVEIK